MPSARSANDMPRTLPQGSAVGAIDGLVVRKGITVPQFHDWVDSLDLRTIILARDGDRASHVKEGAEIGDNSSSSAYFGYHYDGAYLEDQPDLCALFCVNAGRGRTPTAFVRSAELLERVLEKAVPVDVLRQIEWVYKDRWGHSVSQPLIKEHPHTAELVLRCSIGVGSLRWSTTPDAETHVSLNKIWTLVSASAQELNPRLHRWENGDFVCWDNWSFLHARLAHQRDRHRHLMRIWLRASPDLL